LVPTLQQQGGVDDVSSHDIPFVNSVFDSLTQLMANYSIQSEHAAFLLNDIDDGSMIANMMPFFHRRGGVTTTILVNSWSESVELWSSSMCAENQVAICELSSFVLTHQLPNSPVILPTAMS
jgi:hypothetical protein